MAVSRSKRERRHNVSDPSSAPRMEIPGSTRSIDPSCEEVGPTDPSAPVTATVYVRDPAPGEDASSGPVSRSAYHAVHRAREEDIRAVLDFAAASGLAVAEVDRQRRSVLLAGTVGALAEAFGTSLTDYRDPANGVFRGRTGPLTVPSHLSPVITG